MFVRVKKIGAYEYLYLVENAREGGRHVQRVVKALGRRDEVEASGLIDGLIASAARHSRRSIVLSSFYRGELAGAARREHRTRPGVRPAVGGDRLPRRAEEPARDRRFDFDVERAVYLTVLHRLMVSGSDRHARRLAHARARRRRRGARSRDAYKAMAWLGEVDAAGRSTAEASRRRSIAIASRCSVSSSIAFFDTTTLWFEGAGGGEPGPARPFQGLPRHIEAGRARHRARWPTGRSPPS